MASPSEGSLTACNLEQFRSYEDPAMSWIDLVAALKCNDKAEAKACLALAKASHWTHSQWELAMQLAEEEEDPDYKDLEFPNTQPYDLTYENSEEEMDAGVLHAQKLNAMDAMMDQQKLRQVKQEEIDSFFEE